MDYSSHPNFDRELDNFLKKHHQSTVALFHLQNLLANHFEKKLVNLGQPTLVLVGDLNDYKIWRIYMAVKKVTKKQRPRIFFSELTGEIVFLCCVDHTQSYKTLEITRIARERLREIKNI